MSNHWEILKSGRNVVTNTPQELWEAAIEYFKWCDEHPIKIQKMISVGKEAGTPYYESKRRPYTVKGLCLHCGITERYLEDISKTKSADSEYVFVVSRILYAIATQNIEMALIGEYNPILVSKLLNIDREEAPSSSVKILIDRGTPTLSTSEKEILQKLDLEMEEKVRQLQNMPTEQFDKNQK